MKRLLVLSTSTVFGSGYLEYAENEINQFFKDLKQVCFIPFARPSGISHEDYTASAKTVFNKIGIDLYGIHESRNMIESAQNAEAFFIGGGNTFLLLKTLYESGLFPIIKERVESGTPYMGTSAGSNLVGQSINTTNDMPIVYPPSFKAFGFIPFNINPHYLDPISGSKHMGETRETRINEFHTQNDIPVIGLREGSWLDVSGNEVLIKGNLSARFFRANEPAIEIESGTNLLTFLSSQ